MPELWPLVVLSVRDPARAAQLLMAMALPRQALWLGLGLAAVLNTLLFSVSNLAFPGPGPLPGLFEGPVTYLVLVGGGLLATVVAVHRVGLLMGGRGSFDQVLVLMVWMQALRVLVQAAALLLMLSIPLLSAILVMGASLYGVFIFLHFINQAHGLGSLGRAAMVLVGSVLAIAVVLALLLTLIGGPMVGAMVHV